MPAYRRQLDRELARCRKEHPDWPVFLSEGDSWFSYPLAKNVVSWLDDPKDSGESADQTRWSLLRLEENGDEMLQILTGRSRDRLRDRLRRHRPRGLLWSGGGNDLIAGIGSLLRPGATVDECLEPRRVERRLRQIRDAFTDLLDLCEDASPQTVVFTHGYAYAIPADRPARFLGRVGKGPWILPALADPRLGIGDRDLQRAIVRRLIDRFASEVLPPLAARGLEAIDARELVPSRGWNDEIHPNRGSARRVAHAFARRLEERLPDLAAYLPAARLLDRA